jgi:hypothetical protein
MSAMPPEFDPGHGRPHSSRWGRARRAGSAGAAPAPRPSPPPGVAPRGHPDPTGVLLKDLLTVPPSISTPSVSPAGGWDRPDEAVHVSSAVHSFRLASKKVHSFAPYPGSADSRRGLLTAVVLLLVLALGGIAYLLSTNGSSPGSPVGADTPARGPAPIANHAGKPAQAKSPAHAVTTSKAKTHHPPAKSKAKARSKPKRAKAKHPHPPTGLLTAARAQQAFTATWPGFATAANAGDSNVLAQLASPTAVEVAEANRACNCGQFPTVYSSVDLTAPLQKSYPLSFVAEIDGARGRFGPFTVVAILEQQAPKSAWYVGWVTKYVGTTRTLPAGNTVGTSRPPVVAATLATPIQLLAQLFQSVRSSGASPAGNIWSSGLGMPGTEPKDTITALMTAHSQALARHASDTVSYAASYLSPVFASATGWLECGVIGGAILETPARGSVLVQPADHAAYGGDLAAGNYSSVTETDVSDFCVSVSYADVVSPSGLTGGTYSVMGKTA